MIHNIDLGALKMWDRKMTDDQIGGNEIVGHGVPAAIVLVRCTNCVYVYVYGMSHVALCDVYANSNCVMCVSSPRELLTKCARAAGTACIGFVVLPQCPAGRQNGAA